jgi:hypothetical protein
MRAWRHAVTVDTVCCVVVWVCTGGVGVIARCGARPGRQCCFELCVVVLPSSGGSPQHGVTCSVHIPDV